jgi:hypothetical protein
MATGAAVFSPVYAFRNVLPCSASETFSPVQPEKTSRSLLEADLTRISFKQ